MTPRDCYANLSAQEVERLANACRTSAGFARTMGRERLARMLELVANASRGIIGAQSQGPRVDDSPCHPGPHAG